MNHRIKIAPSILAADFSQLGEEIKAVTHAGADLIHIDVMDGHFVPNLTVGPALVNSIRKYSKLPFDVHLMVTNPEKFVDSFIDAGADYLTVHVETPTAKEALYKIKKANKKAGLSISPDTSIAQVQPYLEEIDLMLIMTVYPGFGGQKFMREQVSKIEWLQTQKQQNRFSFDISVDGGVSFENSSLLKEKGATILVAGTTIFKSGNYEHAISALR